MADQETSWINAKRRMTIMSVIVLIIGAMGIVVTALSFTPKRPAYEREQDVDPFRGFQAFLNAVLLSSAFVIGDLAVFIHGLRSNPVAIGWLFKIVVSLAVVFGMLPNVGA